MMRQTLRSICKRVYYPGTTETLFLCFCLCTNFAHAKSFQQDDDLVISGKVLSETNDPLPGVNVFPKGTTTGTVTDANGEFKLTAKRSGILVFSFIGYATAEIPVNNQTQINITLLPDVEQLSEVVVVGYGTQKKSHLTGSVARLENADLDKMPVNNLDQALVGKFAGVQISNTNAAVGTPQRIQVRGVNSINANTNPLVVVDGFPIPTNDLSVVNMADVASVEILKDAASAAIYGSRGANGVILITTKGGNKGKVNVNLNSYVGVKSNALHPDIFPTPAEWGNYVNANLDAFGLTETPLQVSEMVALGTSTNWVDAMTRAGVIQNYGLSVSGGTEKINFYLSGNVMKDQGTYIRNDYDKYNFFAKIDAKVNDRIEMGIAINPSYTRQIDLPMSFHDAIRGAAWLPQYHTEKTLGYAAAAGYTDLTVGDYAAEFHFSNVNGANLTTSTNSSNLAAVHHTDIENVYINNNINAFFKLNILNNLSFKTSFGVFTRNYDREYYRGMKAHRTAQPIGSYQSTNTLNLLNENIIQYDLRRGNHAINALAGYTFQKWFTENAALSAGNFLTDDIHTLNAGSITGGSTTKSEESLISGLARINYDFNDKYLLSVSGRWDASSKFGAHNQWGFFPAVSAGWRVTEESFMQVEQLSNLKLRATYGATGNNGIPNYAALATVSPRNAVLGNSTENGFAQVSQENPDLGWERTFGLNTGLDIGLFNDRLTVSVDYYHAKTDKLLLQLEIPAVTGYKTIWQNRGKLENKGIELELTSRNISTGNLTWSTAFNISGFRNKVLDLGGVDQIISTPDEKRPSQFVTRVGQPLVQYYGYVAGAEIASADLTRPYWPINVGHESIYVRDLTGEGDITTEDRTVLGNPYPNFTWGMTNTITWKKFDVSFVLQGSQGGKVYNIDPYYYETHWMGQNTLTAEEKAQTQIKVSTDLFIQSASYVALRNLQIGYRITAVKGVNAKVYASGQNLIYLVSGSYTSFNPEGVNVFDDNPLTRGYQRGAVPLTRTLALGINIDL